MASGEPAQLYLVLAASNASPAHAIAEAAVKAVPVATLLLVPDANDPPTAADLGLLIATVQEHGVATLLSADGGLARILKADGVHLPVSKTIAADYGNARDTLDSRAIVGADAGRSRHDAMTLGELGADYVGFGIPAHVEDRETARERRLDLVSWWSEIFEIPCVAFDVDSAADAAELSAAGADFIAVTLPHTLEAPRVAEYLAPYAAALRSPAPQV